MTPEIDEDAINTDNILEHFGVRGMKWGVRRSDKELRVAKKARKAEDKAEKARSGDLRKDADKTRYKSSPKKLTDSELSARIKRMETEKKYRELNSRTVGTGEKMAVDVLSTVGTSTAKKLGQGALQYGIRKQLTNKMGSGPASEIMPPPKKK